MKEFVEQLIAHLKTKKGDCRWELCDKMGAEMRKFAEEYKPRTIGDCIRTKTDEELFYLLKGKCPIELEFGSHIAEFTHCEDSDCDECLLRWIKSDVEEGE